jgi:hypothetical protein
MKPVFLWLLLLGAALPARAQSGLEFKKGWVFPFELGQGFIKAANTSELYLVSLQLAPQYTIVPGRLRLGVVAGAVYAGRLDALAGPRVSVKLLEGSQLLSASLYNAQLFGDVQFGTNGQRLVGGGVALEGGQLVRLSLQLQRDLDGGTTWFRTGLAVNLWRNKNRTPEL